MPKTPAQSNNVLTYNMQAGGFRLWLFFQDYVSMRKTLPHCNLSDTDICVRLQTWCLSLRDLMRRLE